MPITLENSTEPLLWCVYTFTIQDSEDNDVAEFNVEETCRNDDPRSQTFKFAGWETGEDEVNWAELGLPEDDYDGLVDLCIEVLKGV